MKITLESEKEALKEAREAVQNKLSTLSNFTGAASDAGTEAYIKTVVTSTIEKFQQELVVFGRIDEDGQPWRIGLYGIDAHSDQLVVDWRARFAQAFYQATFDSPMGLERRVSYVGCIDDLFIEEFTSGEVSGSSPLLSELSKSRGTEMRTSVATLQAEQDELVRLDPDQKLVLRGGPGTGKTVVGLHRAAWLVYNDQRVTADRILVVGPSDKFLQYVSSVLPTLGEARIMQTTFERLFGTSTLTGENERWIEILDRFEESLYQPASIPLGSIRVIPETEVIELVDRLKTRSLPWQERRRIFLESLARKHNTKPAILAKTANAIWPSMTPKQAMKKLSNPNTLLSLGIPQEDISRWSAAAKENGGALWDEVRSRFKGVPQVYSHIIVDEAQDITNLQLRAMQRRSKGITLVGDDAQKSNPNGIGLRHAAELLGVQLQQLDTAYRMSAEIASWLNDFANEQNIDAVKLVGIRPTNVPVQTSTDEHTAKNDLDSRWSNVAVIRSDETWIHKGVEYDAVAVVKKGMTPQEIYLAASRAAHELILIE